MFSVLEINVTSSLYRRQKQPQKSSAYIILSDHKLHIISQNSKSGLPLSQHYFLFCVVKYRQSPVSLIKKRGDGLYRTPLQSEQHQYYFTICI